MKKQYAIDLSGKSGKRLKVSTDETDLDVELELLKRLYWRISIG